MDIIELRDFAGAGQNIEIQLRGYYGWTSGNLASAGSNANAAAPTAATYRRNAAPESLAKCLNNYNPFDITEIVREFEYKIKES